MSFFTGRKQNESTTEQEEAPPPKTSIPQHSIGFDTVLGTNTVMEGTLKSEGNIRLDGEFTGTLDIKGNVLVGETANINADIDARNISVAGAVRGNITGNKVQLLRTGRVWGDIKANALTTEEGAFIDGKISMQEHAAVLPEEDVLEKNEQETIASVSDETIAADSDDEDLAETKSSQDKGLPETIPSQDEE
jgi:cytoskeletal protein CcmA (bactofilin family)